MAKRNTDVGGMISSWEWADVLDDWHQWPPEYLRARPQTHRRRDVAPALPIDDGRMLNLVAEWGPSAEVRTLIPVDNPKRLYDF